MAKRTVLMGLAFSIVLSSASVLFQQIGPIQGFVGTECGDPRNKCYAPVLNGGFPLPFLIDVPTISIPNHLNLDDDFRLWAFLVDAVCYWIGFLLFRQLTTRLNKGKSLRRT